MRPMRMFWVCASASGFGSNAVAVSRPALTRNRRRLELRSLFMICLRSTKRFTRLCRSGFSQFEPLDFAGGGFWQLGHELDPTGIIMRRQICFNVLLQRRSEFGGLRYLVAQYHECFGFDQSVIVCMANHRGFQNRFVRDQHGFDLEWGDPDAADLEHVVSTPAIGKITVLAFDVFIAAPGPGTEKCVAAFLPIVPVIGGAARAGD